MQKKQTKRVKPTRLALMAAVLLVVSAAALAFWYEAGTKREVSTYSVSPTTPLPDTKVHAGPSHDTTPTPTPDSSSVPTPTPTTAPLPAPTGPYDNVGSISLSASTTEMDSTCGEIVGAACYVQATQATRTLIVSSTKTVASNQQGVDLPWNASQLSAGSWSIQVVATLGGQRETSAAQQLTVTN